MGIGAVYNDAQWQWMSEHLGGYNPLCSALEAAFAAPFLIENQGGGGHAIIGQLEGGYRICITTAHAALSSYAGHRRHDSDGTPPGWGIGIYTAADEFSEAIGGPLTRPNSLTTIPAS